MVNRITCKRKHEGTADLNEMRNQKVVIRGLCKGVELLAGARRLWGLGALVAHMHGAELKRRRKALEAKVWGVGRDGILLLAPFDEEEVLEDDE